eukprot:TRINITY_DN11507_c0_g1_i1.p1 TRINITY_DN11507_c0_g1~~TRINITY_DN11507_c0_g1_i1.p1  ORF type:complete len:313 (-),score=67.09 TRINITY_DN11507_c0_g1_i1:88-1026(-)
MRLESIPTSLRLLFLCLVAIGVGFLLSGRSMVEHHENKMEKVENARDRPQKNEVSSYMTKKTVTIAAGARRTGSTWQYVALYNIGKFAKISTRAICLFDSERRPLGNFPSAKLVGKNQNVLLKTHLYDIKLELMADYIFTSYRDVRDELASIIKKNMRGCAFKPENLHLECRRILHSSFVHNLVWLRRADYAARYETFIEKPSSILARMMRVLGVPFQRKDLAIILANIDKDISNRDINSSKNYTDPLYFVTSTHKSEGASPGSYKQVLSPELIACLEATYYDWLQVMKYQVGSVKPVPPHNCISPITQERE